MENNATKKILAGIGNPIIDITNKTDKETIDKYGLIYNQTVFANDSNKGFYIELEKDKNCKYIPGGSVTNSIRASSWLLQNDSKYGCIMIGCIGKDDYGTKIVEGLKKANVEPILEVSDKEESSRCACGILDNVRCLLPEIRASNKLSFDFIKNNIEKISKADILFIEGYFVMDCWEIVKYLANDFKQKGKKIGFTLSAVFVVENFFDKIMHISNLADFIFGNEDECVAFVKGLGHKHSDKDKENAAIIHQNLNKNYERIVILSHGCQPTVVSTWDYDKKDFKELEQIPVIKIDENKIEDTNGCGDALVGGFMIEYLKGSDLKTCTKAGQYLAYEVIQQVGCNFPEKPDMNKMKN